MTDENTLNLRVRKNLTAKEKFVNKSNVCYLKSLRSDINALGWALIVLLAAISVIGAALLDSLLISFLLAPVLIYLYLKSMDEIKIATIADSDKLATDDMKEIEAEFDRNTIEYFGVKGDYTDLLNKYSYKYKFFPVNIDNVQRGNIISKKSYLLALFILWTVGVSSEVFVISDTYISRFDLAYQMATLASLTVLITFLVDYITRSVLGIYNVNNRWRIVEYAITTIPCMLATAEYVGDSFLGIGGAVILFTWSLYVLTLYIFLQYSQGIIITSQSGEKTAFVVSDEDSREIIRQFQAKVS